VYKATEKKSGEIRAIKALKKVAMNSISKMSFIAEIDLLKKLDHPNIIKLYDLFLHDGNYYVVT
jgi:calcium-dependent protein kinase